MNAYSRLVCQSLKSLQLAYDAYKAKKIIQSRDISYAFTNVMANNYYSLRKYPICSLPPRYPHDSDRLLHPGSYDHFCFFCHINDSTKTLDNFAFFVFFTFKSNLKQSNESKLQILTLCQVGSDCYLLMAHVKLSMVSPYTLSIFLQKIRVTSGILISILAEVM